jgi:hypothetical protein
MIGWLLDRLLGPRCPIGCGQRVFSRDVTAHYLIDHAGDRHG